MELDLPITALPVITTLTAGIILLLQMILMINVGRVRGATNTLFGSGDETLQKAVRVHGNLTENAGIFMVTFALLEMIGGATWIVATLCGVFVIARVAHAIGLSMSTGVGAPRFIGALGTLLTGLVAGGYAAWLGAQHVLG